MDRSLPNTYTCPRKSDPRQVTYAYDKDGDTTGITYPISTSATWPTTDTVAYTFDNADEMSSVTDFNSHAVSVTNDADGLPTSLALGSSGDTIATTYDATDAPSAINLKQGSTTLLGFSYSDTASGGIASETDTPSSSIEPASYSYDSQSRVTQMTPGSSTALNYAYDASGNLTTLPTSATATYDDSGALTSSTLSSTTTNYAYNANGDQTTSTQGSSTITSSSWNGANELTSFSDSASNMSAATYDGDGLRLIQTTGTGGSAVTQDFVWNTVNSVPQLLMDGTNAYIYGPGSTPIEEVNLSSGTLKYLVADSLGSVRGVVSSGGSLTASTSYTAYGNPETTGGITSYTPFGFAGGYTDATGLVYLINRYYDPSTGQFITVDPDVEETGQPYAYTGDDPVNATDPLGLFCLLGTNPGGGCRGGSEANWTNRTINPGYYAYQGYVKEYQAAQNGCSLWTVAKYGTEGVFGVASSALLVTGVGEGVNALRGAAGAEEAASSFEVAEENAGHIFRNAPGHLAEDTAANRQLLQETANDSANYIGTDSNGVATYRQTLPDGKQAWAEVYKGQITNGGVNDAPR